LIVVIIVVFLVRSDEEPKPAESTPYSRKRHALRPLLFTTPSAWSAVLTKNTWETSPPSWPSIHQSATPGLSSKLDSILSLIRSNYILPWYSRLSPSPGFPNAVELLIRHVIGELVERAEQVDWSKLMVSRITPLVKDHLQHYRSVEHLASSSSGPSPNPVLALPLPKNAHPALSRQDVDASATLINIEMHLRGWLEKVTRATLPDTDKSEVVMALMREILLCTVLLPVVDMLSESDFWNRQIDEKGGNYLHEQWVGFRLQRIVLG
jgi:sorting nexin-25